MYYGSSRTEKGNCSRCGKRRVLKKRVVSLTRREYLCSECRSVDMVTEQEDDDDE